jgi:hypothetical protein
MRELMKRSQRKHMDDPFYRAIASRRFKNLQGEAISATDTFTADTTAKYRLGSRAYTTDGRVYHYGGIGGVAAVAGSLYQSSAPVAGNLSQTPAAAAIGATQVTITAITTTVTANQYAEGYLGVDTTPGQGIMYGISSHPAATGGNPLVLNLYPDESIQVALTASSRVGLMANAYSGLIITPTARTAIIAGWPNVSAALSTFCWIQTYGPVQALINGTPTITAPVVNSGTTAGAVDLWTTAAAAVVVTLVGEAMQVGVSTKNNFVFARIA